MSGWGRLSFKDKILARREFFESEGEIQKLLDIWQIIHRDEEFIKKAIKKVKMKASFPNNTDLSQHIPITSHRLAVEVMIYVKNGNLIFKNKSFKEELKLE